MLNVCGRVAMVLMGVLLVGCSSNSGGGPCDSGVISRYNNLVIYKCDSFYSVSDADSCIAGVDQFLDKYPKVNCEAKKVLSGNHFFITKSHVESFKSDAERFRTSRLATEDSKSRPSNSPEINGSTYETTPRSSGITQRACTFSEERDFKATQSQCRVLSTDEQLVACMGAMELFLEKHPSTNCVGDYSYVTRKYSMVIDSKGMRQTLDKIYASVEKDKALVESQESEGSEEGDEASGEDNGSVDDQEKIEESV